MDAVEVGKDLFMEASQFLVEADGTVTFGFGAFIFVGTAGAILTLVKLWQRHSIVEASKSLP